MNGQIAVLTKDIFPNPYQPRMSEDPDAIAELAASILRDGLMQVPTGRPQPDHPDCYELAFGHSRLAAFRLLAEKYQGYHEMPLIVRELTDLQMFELGLAENIKRRNLNPMETARAMRRYLDDFHKTSEEAAEFFSVSAETVRGTVRLLNLPAPIQEQISRGDVNISTARKFLTVAPVLDEETIVDISDELVKGKYESPEEISERITDALRDNMFEMWGRWQKDKDTPRGGKQLWPLTWKHAGLPAMTPAGVVSALNLDCEPEDIRGMVSMLNGGMEQPEDPDENDTHRRVRLLLNPRPCTECPLYVRMDGIHYCGLKACWDRKKKAWIAAEFNKVVAKSGIAVYDKDVDGPGIEPDFYQREGWKKRFEAKDPDLRLKPGFQDYSPDTVTGSYYAVAVDVNPKHVAKRKADKDKDGVYRNSNSPEAEAKRIRERELRNASDQFMATAIPVFAAGFEELKNIPAMMAICEVEADVTVESSWSRAKKLQALHEGLAQLALRESVDWEDLNKGPATVAKHLAGVAKTWGIALPKDWEDRAQALLPAQEPEAPKKSGKAAAKKSR